MEWFYYIDPQRRMAMELNPPHPAMNWRCYEKECVSTYQEYWNCCDEIPGHEYTDTQSTSSSLIIFSKLWTNLHTSVEGRPRSSDWLASKIRLMRNQERGMHNPPLEPPEPHLRQRLSPGEGTVKLNIYSHLLNSSQCEQAVMLRYLPRRMSGRCCEDEKLRWNFWKSPSVHS